MKNIAAALLFSFFAISTFAAGLSQNYKDWPHSPQAYFMTSAERAQWSSVRTDAEAEQFVNDFIAKRGGDAFVKEVSQNAAQADKYLTVAKTPGSKTLRGKMMILLGPPGAISAKKKKSSGDFRATPATAGNAINGANVEDMMAAANSPGNIQVTVAEYTYTYSADKLPPAYGKSLVVKIEVDPSGQDRISTYGAEKELDKLYEMVAQARLAAAKPPTP